MSIATLRVCTKCQEAKHFARLTAVENGWFEKAKEHLAQ